MFISLQWTLFALASLFYIRHIMNTAGALPCPRDGNGLFKVVHVSRMSVRKKTRQKSYNSRNLAVAKIIFEKLIEAVFLKGTGSNWIPAAASSGPLVTLAESLIKKKYLLSRNLRSQFTRIQYYDGCLSKRQADIPKMEVQEASQPRGQKCRVRAYRGRRFPIVSRQSQEMFVVQEWIRYALEKDCLKVSTYIAAYELFRETFKRYKTVDGKAMYIGYLILLRPQPENTCAPSTARERERRAHHTPSAQRDVQGGAGGVDVAEASSGAGEVTASNRTSTKNVEGDLQEDDRQIINHTFRMLEAAQNDRVFYLLCSIVDESSRTLSGIYAACALERSVTELQSKTFIQDILEYSRGRYFGVKDSEEHLARRERIEMNVTVLKAARRMYNLPSYEDMSWREAPEMRGNNDEQLAAVEIPPQRRLLERRARTAAVRRRSAC